MSKVKKNLERYVDEIFQDAMKETGLLLKGDPIINVKSRSVSAIGIDLNEGENMFAVEFDKKGEKVQKQLYSYTSSRNYEMAWRGVEFDNHKKFVKAISGSHRKQHKTAQRLISNEATLQKGVDMMELIPGVSDMHISIINYPDIVSYM